MKLDVKIKPDSKNKLGETVVKAMEIGDRSRIPILFAANPGLGKSTTAQNYAVWKNYHIEIVIGASFLPEDINGYQVYNGKDALNHLVPVWFQRIWNEHKEGRPTLLFFDEITTSSQETQNALLHVMKERKLTSGEPLPEDTIVLLAANYKGNLSPEAHLIVPTINRCIVYNIGDSHYVNTTDIINEFTQPHIPEVKVDFENNEITEEKREQIYNRINKFFVQLFGVYAKTKNGSSGYLDLFNKKYDDLYEIDGELYNVITPRTINNLCIATETLINMGIKVDDPFLNQTLLGLIGAGTCNFNPDQLESYHASAIELYQAAYTELTLNNDDSNAQETILDFSGKSINEAVKYWENYYESDKGRLDVNIIELHNYLGIEFKKIDWSNLTIADEPMLIAIRESIQRIANTIAFAESDASDKNKDRIMKCLESYTKWVKTIDENVLPKLR